MKIRFRPAWRMQLGLVSLSIVFFCVSILSANAIAILSLVSFLGFLGLIGRVAYERYRWSFKIERGFIIRRMGILSRHEKSIPIPTLRLIDLDQTVLERVLGIGTLVFYTAGNDEREFDFFGVKKPARLKRMLEAEIKEYQSDDGYQVILGDGAPRGRRVSKDTTLEYPRLTSRPRRLIGRQ